MVIPVYVSENLEPPVFRPVLWNVEPKKLWIIFY